MTSELSPPTLIEHQGALDELLGVLAHESEIAVDTEADSFFSYREKVCLIQMTAGGRDYLIDPLSKVDITGLGEVFADPQRVKIFHDGEYDVLILGREYGFRFANLFDTRVAASALGSENPGLASVLEEHFDIVLDKSMQRSNWGERPLTERQVDYARLDTHYLHELMYRQVAQLDESGRRMIVEGECRRLEALDPVPLQFNPDDWVRLKGARALSPASRSALRELFLLRDELAHAQDVPPFRIMNNQAMIDAAVERPRNTQALSEIRGFTWRQVRKLGDQVIAALERAKQNGPIDELPRLAPKDGTGNLDLTQIELFDRLKEWRRNCSRKEQFDASLILNRHSLIRLIERQPRTIEDLRQVEGLLDWQVERYGEQILKVFSKLAEDVAAGRFVPGRRSSARGPRGRR